MAKIPAKHEISKSDSVEDSEDSDVFYIFYENSSSEENDDDAPGSGGGGLGSVVSVPTVKARLPPPAPLHPPVEPPNSQFQPPSADEIRTIYVPIENAINIPDSFDIK